jgi:hypothetical protein
MMELFAVNNLALTQLLSKRKFLSLRETPLKYLKGVLILAMSWLKFSCARRKYEMEIQSSVQVRHLFITAGDGVIRIYEKGDKDLRIFDGSGLTLIFNILRLLIRHISCPVAFCGRKQLSQMKWFLSYQRT